MTDRGIVFNIQKFCVHDGPGIRTTVFLKGCPLRCLWCANPESQFGDIETDARGNVYGEEKTVDEVMAEVLKDKPFYEESGGGITLSGGEPLYQADFALSLLRACKELDINTALETTGFAGRGDLELASKLTDLFLFDVKHVDAIKHKAGTGADNAIIIENLLWLIRNGKRVIARIPVIPGFNFSKADARLISAFLADAGVERVDLLPFHQFGENKYELLGREYALKGAPALREESLREYEEIFKNRGLLPS